MNKLSVALATGIFASTVTAQVVAPLGTGNAGSAASQTASAAAGEPAGKADASASAARHHKKAKKSTVKLGVKTGTVKHDPWNTQTPSHQ